MSSAPAPPSSSSSPSPSVYSFHVSSPSYPSQDFPLSPSADSTEESIDLSSSLNFSSSPHTSSPSSAAPRDPKSEILQSIVSQISSSISQVKENQEKIMKTQENRHIIETAAICRKLCIIQQLSVKQAEQRNKADSQVISFDHCLTSCASLYISSFEWIKNQLAKEIQYETNEQQE